MCHQFSRISCSFSIPNPTLPHVRLLSVPKYLYLRSSLCSCSRMPTQFRTIKRTSPFSRVVIDLWESQDVLLRLRAVWSWYVRQWLEQGWLAYISRNQIFIFDRHSCETASNAAPAPLPSRCCMLQLLDLSRREPCSIKPDGQVRSNDRKRYFNSLGQMLKEDSFLMVDLLELTGDFTSLVVQRR